MKNFNISPKTFDLIIILVLILYNITIINGDFKFLNNKSKESINSDYEDKIANEDDYSDSIENLSIENNMETTTKRINIKTSEFKNKILKVIEDVVKENLLNLDNKYVNNITEKKAKGFIKVSEKENKINGEETKYIKSNPLLADSWKLNNRKVNRHGKLMTEVEDIINGNIKDNASTIFPFAACVLKKGSYITHGALLNNQWVVTAAFDLLNVRESIKIYTVRLGSMNCKKGEKYPLKSIQIHPSFVKGLPDFDLAMLKIAYPIQFSENIRPIPMARENNRPIFAVTYSRKSSFEENKQTFYKQMNLCELYKYAWEKCRKWLKKVSGQLNETSQCVRPEIRCQGWRPHSSAPLITREGLVGIISGFQPKPTLEKDPVIFTSLTMPLVSDWIEGLLLWK